MDKLKNHEYSKINLTQVIFGPLIQNLARLLIFIQQYSTTP